MAPFLPASRHNTGTELNLKLPAISQRQSVIPSWGASNIGARCNFDALLNGNQSTFALSRRQKTFAVRRNWAFCKKLFCCWMWGLDGSEFRLTLRLFKKLWHEFLLRLRLVFFIDTIYFVNVNMNIRRETSYWKISTWMPSSCLSVSKHIRLKCPYFDTLLNIADLHCN
jgi:hypothetical protein